MAASTASIDEFLSGPLVKWEVFVRNFAQDREIGMATGHISEKRQLRHLRIHSRNVLVLLHFWEFLEELF
ncbi:unnamed protein product [Acanthoscelides obtectus]|uniref:Uncharacterized protein n=1 Tax=Acanthoscelides obtectus TaxID=200917 RepID=A0A9P0P9C4_ACAOB|nr:unnamed protein product [Acanthoscelides obtectus]CAK1629307.1 hypothetical protein AOBTE_LOCUS5671 [Acanthoscelides obtectus]